MPFHHLPPVSLEPWELPSCSPGSVHARELQEEVFKMLLKGPLEPEDQPSPGFYSRLFLAEKVMGGWWPIIDMSTLNGFVTPSEWFQIETVTSVLRSIRKGDWMFSVDLKDAYFQIPVHPEFQLFLRFCLEGWVYQFMPCVSVCPRPCRCSPESSLWFRSGRTGGACVYSVTWTIG